LSDYVSVLLGLGDGSFAPEQRFGAGVLPRFVAVGDFDGNGAQDLAVANALGVSVLLGLGDGSFAPELHFGAGRHPDSVAVGDFDGNGALDLAVANNESDDVSVLQGLGDGSFAPELCFGAGNTPSSVAVGDFDGNDAQDLAAANWSSHDVSVLLNQRQGPTDSDGDGIYDEVDFCPDTVIPESVPTNHLGVNRWALVDDDDLFDTTPPPGGGGGPDFEFTLQDTGGCSCEQIIEAWALGWGHTKFGCSTGAMLQWIAYVGDYNLAQIETEPRQTTPGAIQTPMESVNDPSASAQGITSDPDPRRQQSLTPRRTVQPRNKRN